MNIKEAFLSALASPPKYPAGFRPKDFPGIIHTAEPDDSSPLFFLLSAGITKVTTPFSFDIRTLDCFLFLYTTAGCGKLVIGNQVYSLTPSSLLFLDCRERFRLDIAIEPWEYRLFFVAGSSLSYYYQLLPDSKPALIDIAPFSQTALQLDKLMHLTGSCNITNTLQISSLIGCVLTDCITASVADVSKPHQVATYLTDIKALFDNNFAETYSLDELAEQFHISKYRLCREFGSAFGMPPLKYLNHRRIEIAQHLLLTTDLKIHEVGSKVGIDNTNHFISLFRQTHGTTPLEYKQRMTF